MITFKLKSIFDKKATVLLIDESQIKTKKFAFKNDALKKEILLLKSNGQFLAKDGQLFPIARGDKIILLVGLGERKNLTETKIRIIIKKVLRSQYLKSIHIIDLISHDQKDSTIKCVIEGILIGNYKWKKYKTKDKEDTTVDEKDVTIIANKKKLFEETIQICRGTNLARDMINDNADVVTADYFEKTIKGIVKGKKNITLEILSKKELKAKGLNLHLAVNQGSNKEPKLIIVKYKGSSAKGNYTAFVGKGITFDSGGLNLKPTRSMETMKSDMSGAAAVVGTLMNVISLNLKKNILFVCACAENAIGKGAYKPGDIFKSYSGKTVEIGNTDAEGRLVLADAVSYIEKNYKPKLIIDIATLTGACIVALGYDYTGLVSSDDSLANKLLRSAQETDDRTWRLPIYKEMSEAMKSKIADFCNTSCIKGAGTITGAQFIKNFIEKTPWAHLDIAGTSFVDGQSRMYFNHGGTGAGVRLMTNFLQKN